ncbi:hypothetical protein [uncultured Tateyamaria sp.]|uniref:hypothetical protein n=1 Tax=uncultured Tateyamaria sp. TaxID=455651 RepID=UPI002619D959|nr:hypothetical protein [uncultured Tateyamaria sp.]
MRILTTSMLVATLTLSACGAVRDSRINPFNWFGNARSEPIQRTVEKNDNPLIPEERAGLFSSVRGETELYLGTPIDQVSALVIERVPGGAILRATGIAAIDGVYDVRLTPDNDDLEPDENGVLTFRFEGIKPEARVRRTSERQRTYNVAARLTDQELSRVRTIRVEGERNAQTIARR